MILELFRHLKGYSVLHGSPGLETLEVVETITRDNTKDYLTIQFQSGKFTHILLGSFDYWLENGEVSFRRAAGFDAVESLKDLE